MRASFNRSAASATAAAFVLLLAAASPALASPLLDLDGDAASAAGLQPRLVPGGAAAAYFNPALLPDAPMGLTLGFMVLGQQIGIEVGEWPLQADSRGKDGGPDDRKSIETPAFDNGPDRQSHANTLSCSARTTVRGPNGPTTQNSNAVRLEGERPTGPPALPPLPARSA